MLLFCTMISPSMICEVLMRAVKLNSWEVTTLFTQDGNDDAGVVSWTSKKTCGSLRTRIDSTRLLRYAVPVT